MSRRRQAPPLTPEQRAIASKLVALRDEVFELQAAGDDRGRELAEVHNAASSAYVEGALDRARWILAARSTPATALRRARESRGPATVIDARKLLRARAAKERT